MRKISIGMIILSIIIIGMLIPVGFSANDNQVVITYGETTHHNSNYKNIVDDFFVKQAGVDLYTVDAKIITANEVNKISSTITGKYYNSEQIFSSALVDLNDNDNLEGYEKSTDRKKFTWQPHGSQFTISSTVPDTRLKLRIKKPPMLNKDDFLEAIRFDPSWIEVVE